MLTRNFWGLAFERALKSAAQAAILAYTSSAVGATTLDWSTPSILAVSALSGAVLSILTSIASAPVSGNPASPSLVEETPAP